MASGFKKFIDALNKPIGGSGNSSKSIEKNMSLKVDSSIPIII